MKFGVYSFFFTVVMFLGFMIGYAMHQPQPVQVGRYRQFGMGPLIIDTATGQVCDGYPGTSQMPGGYPPCRWIK